MTPRDTPSPTDHRTGAPPDALDVAIVGGGIAGLYCGLQLFDKYSSSGVSEPMRTVALFEGSSRLGGRIESWRIDPKRYDGIRSKAIPSSTRTIRDSLRARSDRRPKCSRDHRSTSRKTRSVAASAASDGRDA